MKKLLFFLGIMMSTYYYSQTNFVNGYFIDANNNKTECLIKNYDWANIPNEIEYKLSDESNVETIDFGRMKAFRIYDTPHYYKKATVMVDFNAKRKEVAPVEQSVVLRVLIEGKASLYNISTIFFYQKDDGEIKQLLFKEYLEGIKNYKDNWFRTELINELECGDNAAKIKKIAYEKKDMLSFFRNYNECTFSNFTDYTIVKSGMPKYNLKIQSGVSFNNFSKDINFLSLKGDAAIPYSFSTDPAFQVSFAIGVEFEGILPFNNDNWSIYVSPNLQIYNNTYSKTHYSVYNDKYEAGWAPSTGTIIRSYSYDFEVYTESQYYFLELPIGARRYFYISPDSRIFIEGSFGVIVPLKVTDRIELNQINTDPKAPPYMLDGNEFNPIITSTTKFGAGYTFQNKFSISAQYSLYKRISNIHGNSFSIMLGYRLF